MAFSVKEVNKTLHNQHLQQIQEEIDCAHEQQRELKAEGDELKAQNAKIKEEFGFSTEEFDMVYHNTKIMMERNNKLRSTIANCVNPKIKQIEQEFEDEERKAKEKGAIMVHLPTFHETLRHYLDYMFRYRDYTNPTMGKWLVNQMDKNVQCYDDYAKSYIAGKKAYDTISQKKINAKQSEALHRVVRFKTKQMNSATKKMVEILFTIRSIWKNLKKDLMSNAKKQLLQELIFDDDDIEHPQKIHELYCFDCDAEPDGKYRLDPFEWCWCGLNYCCNYCGKSPPKLKKCSGCQDRWYCSRKCQKKGWTRFNHRHSCPNLN